MSKRPAALAEVMGPWSDATVRGEILGFLNDGFTVIHMTMEKRKVDYVSPNDPSYHTRQYQTNSGDQILVTYLARSGS